MTSVLRLLTSLSSVQVVHRSELYDDESVCGPNAEQCDGPTMASGAP